MDYWCNACKNQITDLEYAYSKLNFGKPLCRLHQRTLTAKTAKSQDKTSTPEAARLAAALRKRGVKLNTEKWDGYKHIDIAIPDAKVNIEVDGSHHNLNSKQALADLKRTYHSFRKGWLTLRIPNSLTGEKLEETADYITEFLNESVDELEEDE